MDLVTTGYMLNIGLSKQQDFLTTKSDNIVEDITQEIRAEVIIYRVNLLKACVNEADDLRSLLDKQITIGHSKIVVDLSQCTYLD